MKVNCLARYCFVALVLSLPSIEAAAQNPGVGAYPFSKLDTPGFDSINPGNLNAHFAVPIVNKTGRGIPFQYSLVFDSLIWTPAVSGSSKVWSPDATFGFHGYLLNDGYKGFLSYSNITKKCFSDPNNPGFYELLPVLSQYVYHDEFGVTHRFNYSYSVCTGTATGNGSTSDGSGFLYDGSFVHSRSGSALALPEYVNGAPGSLTGTITDSNGNKVTNNLNGTFTDTMGLTPLTITGGGSASSPRVFTYKTTTGTAQITISYTTKTVKTNFGCTGTTAVTDYGPLSVDLPTTITLGDNTSTYAFTYEATPGYAGDVTGRIASVKLPTGGTISYAYSGTNNGINCSDGSTLGLARSTSISSDGTTSYARTGNHTEITSAHQDQTEIDYVSNTGVPYETTRSVYAGSHTSGTLLAKSDTCYNGTVPNNCTSQTLTLPISSIGSYLTSGSSMRGSDTIYNSGGLVTEVKEYNYGSGARGPVLRDTKYTYAALGGYATDRVNSVNTYSAAGTLYSSTTYGYDERAPSSLSPMPPQLVTPSGPRGNVTSVHVYTSSSKSLTTNVFVDVAGQITSKQDLNQSAGGTSYPTSTVFAHDSSTDTLITQVTPPAPGGVSLPTQYGNSSDTGLVTSTTDPNNIQTVYQYDNMLRPTTSTVAGNQVAWNGYTPTQVSSYRYQNASTFTDIEALSDALGRPSRVAESNGQSSNPWYQADSCYNNAGLSTFSSYRYQGNGWATSQVCSGSGGDTTNYDALGRVTTITHGDGKSVTLSYAGTATKISDENSVGKIAQVDGIGRVTAVCEISSNNSMPGSGSSVNCGMELTGAGFLTTYTYDDANRKVTVMQGAQARIFQTDWTGRPILLQQPESGQTTFGYDYNSTGLIVTRTKPRANQTNVNTTTASTMQYDLIRRLLSVTYSDGTPTRTYTYDNGSLWGTTLANPKGHLTQAMSSANAGTIFSYDSLGHVVWQPQCTPATCGSSSYAPTYTFDWEGNMLTSTNGDSYTNTFSYTSANEIQTITTTLINSSHPPTLLSNVQNGPSGPKSWQLGNGLTGVKSYDVMGRVSGGWVCRNSTQPACTGGTQTYGFSTIWSGVRETDECDTVLNKCLSHGYDEFNRLTSRTVTTGTAENYTYVYDRYGNRWQQNALNGGYSPQLTFDTSTNRMVANGFAYDAAGNLTNDGLHTYTYDAEGNMTAVDGGASATYVYDALNRRVRTNQGSTSTEYVFNLNNQRATGWTTTGSLVQGHIYWGSAPYELYSNGYAQFDHQDWLGTERMRTKFDGTVDGTFTSLPYGDGLSTTSGVDNDAYHTAMLDRDTTSGTDHAQFRQYGASQGRWMVPDPYSGSYDSSDPQSLNRYAYVQNNPLAMIDPLGLMEDNTCGNEPGLGYVCGMGGSGGGGDSWGWGGGSGGGRGRLPQLPLPTEGGGGGVGGARSAPNSENNCSVLDPNCKKPGPVQKYVDFLGCEANDTMETVDAQDPLGKFLLVNGAFQAKWAVKFFNVGLKVKGVNLLSMALAAGYLDMLSLHANQTCTKQIYGSN